MTSPPVPVPEGGTTGGSAGLSGTITGGALGSGGSVGNGGVVGTGGIGFGGARGSGGFLGVTVEPRLARAAPPGTRAAGKGVAWAPGVQEEAGCPWGYRWGDVCRVQPRLHRGPGLRRRLLRAVSVVRNYLHHYERLPVEHDLR